MAKPEQDYYEQDNFDQDPREADDKGAKDENEYQTFLAPKNAFPEASREVGAVHRVKTVRSLENELELQCIEHRGEDDKENDDSEDLYQ